MAFVNSKAIIMSTALKVFKIYYKMQATLVVRATLLYHKYHMHLSTRTAHCADIYTENIN